MNEMQQDGKRKQALLSKIERKQDALAIINEVSITLYLIAAIQIGIGFFTQSNVLIDGLLYGLLAFLLRKFHSRASAIALVLLALGEIIFIAVGGGMWGRNIVLSIVILLISARAIEATIKLPKFPATLPD